MKVEQGKTPNAETDHIKLEDTMGTTLTLGTSTVGVRTTKSKSITPFLPAVGRVVMWHRVGPLEVTESSVVVAVSAPHRGEAFSAARFAIDMLKTSVPIWKRETWQGGSDWGLDAHDLTRKGA